MSFCLTLLLLLGAGFASGWGLQPAGRFQGAFQPAGGVHQLAGSDALAGVTRVSFASPAYAQEPEMLEPPEPVWSEGFLKSVRRQVRAVSWHLKYAFRTWWPYAVRAFLFLLLAAGVGILDRRLIEAWRGEGLRALADHVPVMLYVYTALFFDGRVGRLAKIFLLGSIVYGAARRDLVPDRSFEALLDDVLLVAIAARVFVATCAEDLVLETARRAVRWQQRVRSLHDTR